MWSKRAWAPPLRRTDGLSVRSSRPPSLVGRLTVWHTLATVAVILTVSALFYAVQSRVLREDYDDLLFGQTRVLWRLLVDEHTALPDLRAYVVSLADEFESARIYVRILDPAGNSMCETPGMAEVLPIRIFPRLNDASTDRWGRSVRVKGPTGLVFRAVVAWAWIGGHPGGYAVIQAAVDDTRGDELQKVWYVLLAIALLVAAALSWILATQVTRRGLRPLYVILGTTRRIQSSALAERVPSDAMPAELAHLAADFNHMLDRLEESFLRQSQFSANVAHELRTPLNNLHGQMEVALRVESSVEEYRNVLASNLEECQRLSGIVDRLLFLARLEGSETLSRQHCNLTRELEEVLAYYEPVAAEKGVGLRLEAGPEEWGNLDPILVRRAAANLISNALAGTPAGGAVVICAGRRDSGLCVEVRDTGVGIAPEHIPHLFDRFYRVDPSRCSLLGGVGLGLSIVKAIMDLHGGSVHITSRQGHGTCALLVFPAVAQP